MKDPQQVLTILARGTVGLALGSFFNTLPGWSQTGPGSDDVEKHH